MKQHIPGGPVGPLSPSVMAGRPREILASEDVDKGYFKVTSSGALGSVEAPQQFV